MPHKIERCNLSGPPLEWLSQSFSEPAPSELLEVYKKRPRPSQLRRRLHELTFRTDRKSHEDSALIESILRIINRSWEAYTEGSVAPNEFLRTPLGAAHEIVSIEGKGRGMIASRTIKAGETILQETPVMMVPLETANTLLFLLLLQQALEAILLLHNAHANERPVLSQIDIPIHRLLDALIGIMGTNAFSGFGSYGMSGVLLLRGSLFKHNDKPNLRRQWDPEMEYMEFMSTRDIYEGEKLEVDYLPDLTGSAKVAKLKLYGL